MNKKIIKKIFIFVFYFIAVAGSCWFIYYLNISSQEGKEEEKEWEVAVYASIGSDVVVAAETDRLKLYFQEDSAQFWVEDKETKEIWRSNPEKASEDKVAFGMNKSNILSQIIVEYIDSQSSLNIINSNAGSVKEKTFEYKLADNGVYVTYKFKATGFEIPVYYGLKEDYFTAKILCDDIIQHLSFQITEIKFLPFMGCGSATDVGYLVIPDGSGSIMNFNNQKQTYLAYSQPVYGRDLALNTLSKTEVKQDITMPVFGIKRNDYAMLGIIAQGEYQAEIGAEVSGKSSTNNMAYSKICFMQVETNKLLANTVNEKNAELWSEQFNQFPEYEVRYYFLEKNATYTDMALRYQKYLVDEKGMTELPEKDCDTAKINVDFVGATEKIDTILGIPYKTVEVLTSYSEVAENAENLILNGNLDLNIRYTGFLKGGLTGKLPSKITYDYRLGGKSDFKKTKSELEASGIGFYPSFNLIDMYQTGAGYYKVNSARCVNRSAAHQYDYLLSTGEKDSTRKPNYLLAPDKVSGLGDKLNKEITKNDYSAVALESITNSLYSNFKKNGTSRNEAGNIFVGVIANIAQNSESLLLDKPYGYAMPYADIITNTPVYSSEYDMTDGSIPFYQIVMSGYATLYSEPVNMKGNIKEYLLKLAETGVNPSFLLIAKDPFILMNTDYAWMYAIGYDNWKEEIIDIAELFTKLTAVNGQRIIGHDEVTGNLFKTSYSNGAVVYTNYNDSPITIDGITIQANDFSVKGGM